MKFCTQCGTQLNDNAIFCSKCGAKQEEIENTPIVETTPIVIDFPVVEKVQFVREESVENESAKKETRLLKTIQCMGATAFNLDRKLYIYDNRIALLKDSLEVVFECYYDEIKSLKTGGALAPTFLKLELINGTQYKFKLNGNDISMLKVAKELPEYITLLRKEYCERNGIDVESFVDTTITPKIEKKVIPYDIIFRYCIIGLTIVDAILVILLVVNVVSKLNRMNVAEEVRTEILQNVSASKEELEQLTEDSSKEKANDTVIEENYDDAANVETSNVLTGVNTYVGVIHKNGLSCYLELDEDISYLDPLDEEPITTNVIQFLESEGKEFDGYDGLTATLEGELFNYRGGGDLWFNGMPKIVNVSGTPTIADKKTTYANWDTTDNETKYYDAMEILRTVAYRCPGVWDVRTLTDMDIVDSINSNGFSFWNPVMLQVNGNWADSLGLCCSVTPFEDHVEISLGPDEAPSVPLWTYDWNAELISGDMPLEDFIESSGLTK